MSYNGSGVYTLPGAQLVNGEIVSATENNQFRNDVATALNTAWTRDGQSTATGNIPMGTHKFTGLSAGTANGDSVRFEQLPSGSNPLAVGSGGTGSTTGAAALVALGNRTGATGSEILPAGTTAQRDGTPAAGYTRFNTDTGAEEYYNGTAWVTVADSSTAATLTGTQTLTNKTLASPVINGTGVNFSDNSIQNTAATGFGFKNRIINGAMMIDQRNAGASVTGAIGAVYSVDRFPIICTAASKLTAQQSATAPAGFSNSLLITSSSAYSVAAGDYLAIQQNIEGFNTADLGWGVAGAATVTLSFWVRCSLTGTFGGALSNSANDYGYPFTYTISSANTWEQKTVTITGPTSGTWVGATNGTGIKVRFGLGVGSTSSNTAGSWVSNANGVWSATGATSVVGTNGATFYITGVQLEKGSTATSFDYRPYGTELQLAQRYCRRVSSAPGLSGSTVNCQISIQHTGMRAAPSATTTAALIVTNIISANYTQSSGSIAIAENNADGGRYNLANFTGMTIGAAAYLISSGGTVLLTAEL